MTEPEQAYLAAGQAWQISEGAYARIARWTELPTGGHFTAWEEPEAFASELSALARECRRC